AQTSYADDFHIQWEFTTTAGFRRYNAIALNVVNLFRVVTHPLQNLGPLKQGSPPSLVPMELLLQRIPLLCSTDRLCRCSTALGPEPVRSQQALPAVWRQHLYPLRIRSMADFSDALQEARAEFDAFGAYMQTPSALVRKDEADTAPTPTPSLGSTEAMETDREVKRNADLNEDKTAAPPPKWAKGEAKGEKGEKTEDAPTGKGRAMEAPQKSPPPATNTPGQGSADPGPQQRTNRGQPQQTPQGGSAARTGQQHQQMAGWRRSGGYRQWPNNRQDRDNSSWDDRQAKEIKELKEDAVGVIHLDCEFILFLQTEAAGNEWAITQQLYETAVQWHRQKESNPESLTNPMRNILLYNLYNALLMKLEALEVDKELMDRAKARGLIEGTTYVYLQWDAATRQHVKAMIQPVEHSDMIQMVKTLKYLATFPNVVGRFHALRKMEDNLNGDIRTGQQSPTSYGQS
ncbi:ogdh, partial [Symbiodinium necroappetens]